MRATPSAASERLMGLLDSSPILLSFAACCVIFQLRPLPSTGITRLHRCRVASLVLFHPLRPSHNSRRVGSYIAGFGACSTFTHVTACELAKSPMRPSTSECSSSFVTSTAAPIATGWSEPVSRVETFTPLWTSAFLHGALEVRLFPVDPWMVAALGIVAF